MWLAHALTLSRLALAGVFWLAVDRPWRALGVLAVAALTDVIDGHIARIARRRRQQAGQPPPSPIGEWLDPLCDKTFVLSVLLALWVGPGLPLPLLLAIATREIILVPIAAIYRFTPLLRSRMHYRFRAGLLGKAATVASSWPSPPSCSATRGRRWRRSSPPWWAPLPPSLTSSGA